MAAKLSSRFKSYLVATITQNLRIQNPTEWLPLHSYPAGTQVARNGSIYIAYKGGTSGSVGPTHTDNINMNRTDGTVQWVYYGPAQNPSDINSNLYVGIGRTTEWDDENDPPVATADDEETTATLSSLITISRLGTTNMRLGLKKNEWESGKVYTMFTGGEDDADDPDLYVTVDNDKVFKCIDNNSGYTSTVRPTSIQQGLLVLADGYVWKYMGSISQADLSRFATDDYVPVSVSTIAGTDQYAVQSNARPGELSSFGNISQYTTVGSSSSMTSAVTTIVTRDGVAPTADALVSSSVDSNSVYHIFVTSPGSGYPADTFAISRNAAFAAPATPGTGTLTITAGEITSAAVVNQSSGYPDGCVVVVIGDGTGAAISATLGVDDRISSFSVTDGGEGYTWAQLIVVPGDVATWAKAIRGPFAGHGKNIATELATGTLLISHTVTNSNSPYVEECTFRQVSLISNVSLLTPNAPHAIGPEHTQWASGTQVKYQVGTGQLLYLNNISPVEHMTNQEENIKIAISF